MTRRMSRRYSVGKSWGPTTTRTRRTPLPDAADAAVAGATAGFRAADHHRCGGDTEPAAAAGPVISASVTEPLRLAGEAIPGPKSTLEKRRRSVRMFAEHLEQLPGETWQQRWLASGWEQPDRQLRLLNPARAHAWSMTLGFKWLAAMRAIVPSAAAMRRQAGPDYAELFRAVQSDPLLDEVFARIAGADSSRRYQVVAQTQLAIALTSQAVPMADLGPAALLHFACEWRRGTPEGRTDDRFGGLLAWQVLVRMGHVPPGTPESLRRATLGGRRDNTELVDRYGVHNTQVRQLLIDYLNHRVVAGMDYPTADKLARDLVRNFWVMIEAINPGQADLHLDEGHLPGLARPNRRRRHRGRAASAHRPAHAADAHPGVLSGPAELGTGGTGAVGPVGGPMPDPGHRHPVLLAQPAAADGTDGRPHPTAPTDAADAGRARQ